MKIFNVVKTIDVLIIILFIGNYYIGKIDVQYKCSNLEKKNILSKEVLKNEEFTQESLIKYTYYSEVLMGIHSCSINIKKNKIISSEVNSRFYLF